MMIPRASRLSLFALAALAALSFGGCGPARYPLPDRVRVSVVDATIAPSDARGQAWDGGGQVAAQLVTGLAEATAGLGKRREAERKAAQIIGFVAQAAAQGLAAPDARGYVEMSSPGAPPARITLKESPDTFRPHWASASFSGVPLHEDTRIRVHLEDYDPIGANDPIGTVELSYDDLVDALDAKRVWQVAVADQSQNQLLYVGISVTGE